MHLVVIRDRLPSPLIINSRDAIPLIKMLKDLDHNMKDPIFMLIAKTFGN